MKWQVWDHLWACLMLMAMGWMIYGLVPIKERSRVKIRDWSIYFMQAISSLNCLEKTLDTTSADLMLVGEGNYDYAGFSMANAGDVDGDKLDDWLIGAHKADASEEDMGKTYLLFAKSLADLSGEQSLSNADVVFVGEDVEDFSGYSMAGGSDVDKDGLSDILIGAGNTDANGTDSGAAYLFLGASIQPGEVSLGQADLKLVGSAEGDWAGRSVIAIPSADRNKRGDWAVSSSWNDSSANNAGKVSILTGEQLWSAIKDDKSTLSLSDAQVTIFGSEQEGFLGQYWRLEIWMLIGTLI